MDSVLHREAVVKKRSGGRASSPHNLYDSIGKSVGDLNRIGKEIESASQSIHKVVKIHQGGGQLLSHQNSLRSCQSIPDQQPADSVVSADPSSTGSSIGSPRYSFSSVKACSRTNSIASGNGSDVFELIDAVTHDLTMVQLAAIEYKSILDDLDSALSIEEKEMLTRANYLRRETEQFSKMSQTAVKRIRNAFN